MLSLSTAGKRVQNLESTRECGRALGATDATRNTSPSIQRESGLGLGAGPRYPFFFSIAESILTRDLLNEILSSE